MSLLIRNLSVYIEKRQILKDINLEIKPGFLHAIMGPNGSGKSTLAQAVMGNPALEVRSEKLEVGKKDIRDLKPDERAREGLFLAFQNPVAIAGVTVANLLRTAYQLDKQQTTNNKQQKKMYNPALSVWEFNEILVDKAKKLGIPQEFLRKSLNEAVSGGEKKKLEMLQAVVLSPKFAIFDEIDTGLDIDALQIVARAVSGLKKNGCGIIIITHYQRILRFLKPDRVHILVNGAMVKSGGATLAQEVEKNGYKEWL